MAGFSDLVGRNAPALGVNRAIYTAGDTWGDTLGVFVDNSNTLLDLSAVTISVVISDKPGGTVLLTTSATGTVNGTFSFTIIPANTAGLALGSRRDIVWSCSMTNAAGSKITVWSALESPLTVLSSS